MIDDRYRVKSSAFEGPLDLLLHLVRVREIEIRDSALKSLSDANDFDQLLGFRKDSSRAVGVWSKQTGVWKKEEHRRVDGNRSLDHVIERMNRGKKRKNY